MLYKELGFHGVVTLEGDAVVIIKAVHKIENWEWNEQVILRLSSNC